MVSRQTMQTDIEKERNRFFMVISSVFEFIPELLQLFRAISRWGSAGDSFSHRPGNGYNQRLSRLSVQWGIYRPYFPALRRKPAVSVINSEVVRDTLTVFDAIFLMIRAGTPPTAVMGGTSFVTTAPAATTDCSPLYRQNHKISNTYKEWICILERYAYFCYTRVQK